MRRMSGDESWLPMIADCERGLGRPERALDLLAETDLGKLPEPIRAECLMVLSGARQDMGQKEAALAVLDTDLLRSRVKSVWSARLRLAYADALEALGRTDEAARWLALASASDPEGTSGAGERLAQDDGVELVDLADVGIDPDAGIDAPEADASADAGAAGDPGHSTAARPQPPSRTTDVFGAGAGQTPRARGWGLFRLQIGQPRTR